MEADAKKNVYTRECLHVGRLRRWYADILVCLCVHTHDRSIYVEIYLVNSRANTTRKRGARKRGERRGRIEEERRKKKKGEGREYEDGERWRKVVRRGREREREMERKVEGYRIESGTKRPRVWREKSIAVSRRTQPSRTLSLSLCHFPPPPLSFALSFSFFIQPLPSSPLSGSN